MPLYNYRKHVTGALLPEDPRDYKLDEEDVINFLTTSCKATEILAPDGKTNEKILGKIFMPSLILRNSLDEAKKI